MKIIFIIFIPILLFSHMHKERYYQNIAAKKLHGKVEYKLNHPKARIDILSKTTAYEVDFINKVYESIGQSLYYALRTKRHAGIILIVEKWTKYKRRKLSIAKDICTLYHIRLYTIDINGKMKLIIK